MNGTAIPWARESGPELDKKAATTGTVSLLPDEEEPTRILVEGPCPACGHGTSHSEPLRVLSNHYAVPGVLRGLRRKRKPEAVVEVLCDCATVHPDAPEDGTGCGRSWTLAVSW